MTKKDLPHREYASKTKITWCPGCGDYGVLYALQTALGNLNIPHHKVMISSGIGCSSNLPHFINTYGFHGLHGRSLPFATGVKLANPELTVIATGGDGDGYGIGAGHFVHTCRRNINITYIVMNNQIYGLTTGQVSPTSLYGMRTKTTPTGNLENPVNPISVALAANATFVARGYTGSVDQLISLLQQALQHEGFALVDVISPCVTYNRDNTYTYFEKKIFDLQTENHDKKNLQQAISQALEWEERIPTGIFYQIEKPTYDGKDPGTKYGPLKDRCKPLEDPNALFEGYR